MKATQHLSFWIVLSLFTSACVTKRPPAKPAQSVPSAAPAPAPVPPPTEAEVGAQALVKFCEESAKLYAKNKWGRFVCPKLEAKVFGKSVKGRDLIYFDLGKSDAETLTLIQCGVHGDELPALPMCLNLLDEIQSGRRKVRDKTRIIVQPLLNPDGMFAQPPTRQNARGVDINRNFPTSDWQKEAKTSWENRDRKDPRKFPGNNFNTEPETQAIVKFMEDFRPQKIISIHTPLGFLDLDSHGDSTQQRRAKYLAVNMSKNSGNYRFIRFGFYPGSLGNYAGRQKNIPVYTLELPQGVSQPTIDNYWQKFRIALWRAIDFDLSTGTFVED
jgi:protein MpaA